MGSAQSPTPLPDPGRSAVMEAQGAGDGKSHDSKARTLLGPRVSASELGLPGVRASPSSLHDCLLSGLREN